MSTLVIDSRLKLQLLFWYAVIALALLVLGVNLATNQFFMALLVAGMLWLVMLPYHAQLAMRLAMATFASAFIVPFLPGRMYLWEVASLLGWSGVVILISLRRFPAGLGQTLRRNKWIFVGAAGYCVVLLVTIKARGAGLRVLGSSQMGGRFYFQQMVCAIFPLLFVLCPMKEKTFIRLFVLQCLLSGTYIISDLAYSHYGGAASKLSLTFLEVPGDAANFERQAENFGIRRFQSLSFAGQGFVFALLVFHNLRDFIGRRSVWLAPTALLIIGMTLLSGHRMALISIGSVVLICALAQRFLRPRNLVVAGALLGVILLLVYAFPERLPRAGQRALSFLPGLQVDSQVATDAYSTWATRQELFRLGWDMIPQYFWIGRGFSNAAYGENFSAYEFDQTIAAHLAMGRFYNGFIGLMVNTGVFGFLCMAIFISGGLLSASRVIRHVRRHGSNDNFSRVGALVASLYIFGVIAFLFLHGDSEYAMKSFSLLIGMLLMIERLLNQRLGDSTPDAGSQVV